MTRSHDWEYIEEDNTNVLLTYYSKWIYIKSIAEFFNEELQINSNIKLNTITPNSYI